MEKFVIPNNGLPSTVSAGIQPETQISTVGETTPEYLDSIINNPRENPVIRANALTMKKRLFPEVVTPPEDKSLVINPASVPLAPIVEKVEDVPSPVSYKVLSQNQLKTITDDLQNNLYNQKIELLADDREVCLRSLTVSEYKFLSKQIEIYENVVSRISKDSDDYHKSIKKSESILLGAIDNVLQRCITNNISVSELNFYDWVRLVGILRMISKGDDKTFQTTCSDEKCKNSITININSFVSNIEDYKDKFIKNPVSIIPYKNIKLYISIPTRGDIFAAESMYLQDPEANIDLMNLSMHIKAIIKDNEIFLLQPEQRADLLNSLDMDTETELKRVIEENTNEFYRSVGTYKCSCGKDVTVQMSDFLLFFFTL